MSNTIKSNPDSYAQTITAARHILVTNPFNALELKMPPPLMTLLGALGMWLIARYFPATPLEIPYRPALCAALVISAGVLDLAALLAFHRAKTTASPLRPEASSVLVVSGIYRHSRNPMYCGLLLMLGAWACYLAQALPFLVLPVFVLAMNRFQIIPEERILAARFGASYAAYLKTVRRWI